MKILLKKRALKFIISDEKIVDINKSYPNLMESESVTLNIHHDSNPIISISKERYKYYWYQRQFINEIEILIEQLHLDLSKNIHIDVDVCYGFKFIKYRVRIIPCILRRIYVYYRTKIDRANKNKAKRRNSLC